MSRRSSNLTRTAEVRCHSRHESARSWLALSPRECKMTTPDGRSRTAPRCGGDWNQPSTGPGLGLVVTLEHDDDRSARLGGRLLDLSDPEGRADRLGGDGIGWGCIEHGLSLIHI